jgi:hypothetical protein
VQLAADGDRPGRRLRGVEHCRRLGDLGGCRLHRADDRVDLRRVDAPHPQEAELVARPARVRVHGSGIVERAGDAVRRHDRVGERGGGHSDLRPPDQRVVELASGSPSPWWESRQVGANEMRVPKSRLTSPGTAAMRVPAGARPAAPAPWQ